MVLGMTRGEIGLAAFIFLLVWGAGTLPFLGDLLGAALGSPRTKARSPKGTLPPADGR